MRTLDDLKAQLRQTPEFVREYEALEPEYQVARAVLGLRLQRGFSQAQFRPHGTAFRHPAWLRQEERQDAPARIGDCGTADAGCIGTGGVRDNGYRNV